MSSNISDLKDEIVKYVFTLDLRGTWFRRFCPATLVISGIRMSSKYLHSVYVVHCPEHFTCNINDISDETVKRFTLYLRGTWSRRFCPATLVISRTSLSSKYLYTIYVVHGLEDSVQQH